MARAARQIAAALAPLTDAAKPSRPRRALRGLSGLLGAALALALWPGLAGAQSISLAQPLACTLGETCYIQHYPDRDPGPGLRDFGCGTATYEGHDGTDFAVPTRAAMQAGVAVLAAAAGTVRGARDGEADGAFVAGQSVANKECGNGVLVLHPDGWQTQYCHLRQGSVRVKPGETVAAGDPLGLVGMSGMAEFPHLHLTLRHNGVTIDPFRPDSTASCAAPAAGLWHAPIPYVGGGLLQIGLAAAPPDYGAVKTGLPAATALPAEAAALVLWAYGFDSRAGDRIAFSITGANGFSFAQDAVVEKPQALFYRYAGKRTAAGLAPGRYAASVTLWRDGAQIDGQSTAITVAPR